MLLLVMLFSQAQPLLPVLIPVPLRLLVESALEVTCSSVETALPQETLFSRVQPLLLVLIPVPLRLLVESALEVTCLLAKKYMVKQLIPILVPTSSLSMPLPLLVM